MFIFLKLRTVLNGLELTFDEDAILLFFLINFSP